MLSLEYIEDLRSETTPSPGELQELCDTAIALAHERDEAVALLTRVAMHGGMPLYIQDDINVFLRRAGEAEGVYLSAVQGRSDFRAALRQERQRRKQAEGVLRSLRDEIRKMDHPGELAELRDQADKHFGKWSAREGESDV